MDIPFVDIGAGGLSFEIEEFALGGPVNVQIGAFDSGSNNIFSYGPTSTIPISQINDGNWHSFAWSCDTSTNTLQFAVDRVVFDLSVAAGPWNGNPISWFPASDSWALFALAYSLGLYDLWFNAGDPFFDLTSPVNLNKLFAPGNHPVDWGAIGGNITGSQPAVFLHGDAATFANNVGSGGPWTFGRPSLVTTITGPS